jgi:hypothetical protein
VWRRIMAGSNGAWRRLLGAECAMALDSAVTTGTRRPPWLVSV